MTSTLPADAAGPDAARLDESGPGRHVLSIGTQSAQLDLVAGAFRAALAQGYPCLFIADRTPPGAFREAMAMRGCNLEPPLASGQCRLLTPEQTYIRGGHFDADRMLQTWADVIGSARNDGSPGVCAAGEATWVGRRVPGTDRWVEYEYRLNEMEEACSSDIICLYDAGSMPGWLGEELTKVHPLVHANGLVVANRTFAAGPQQAAEVPLVEELEPPADRLPCARLAELLSAYTDGQLAAARRRQVTEHLRSCGSCRERLASYQTVRRRLSSLRRPGEVGPGFWGEVKIRLAEVPEPLKSPVTEALAGGHAEGEGALCGEGE